MPAIGLENADPHRWRRPLASLITAVLVVGSASPLRAQVTTSCQREQGYRDPLSGVEAWTAEICTTSNRITGQVVRVQSCVTNHRYGTRDCVDQPSPVSVPSPRPKRAQPSGLPGT